MTKRSYLTATDQFCGAGGSSQGAVRAGIEVRMAMNHWELAIETHNSNFPETDHDCTDISAVDPRRYPSTDILITSPECFPAGTLILASSGLVPIENIEPGMQVLTHEGRWREVVRVQSRYADTVIVKGHGHPGLEVTGAHPFYVRRQYQKWDNEKRDYNRRLYDEPTWVDAAHLLDDKYRWATPAAIEELPIAPIGYEFNSDFWWMVGRWLGDGSLRVRHGETRTERPKRPARQWPAPCEVCGQLATKSKRHPHLANFTCGSSKCLGKRYRSNSHSGSSFNISCSYEEVDELLERLALVDGFTWGKRELRTAVLYIANGNAMVEWLIDNFGQKSYGKTIPAWALTMRPEWRQALLFGYASADGHDAGRYTAISTVSKSLAIGARLLAESLGYRTSLLKYESHNDVIEGRKVNTRPPWVVRWENNQSEREAFNDGKHSWLLVKEIRPGSFYVPVYNLEVAEDESYVADGIVVHNCTNHSLAKGKKRKLEQQMQLFGRVEIDPAEERSRATMWDVVRFAEYHNYNLIVVENVVDARAWILYDSWIMAMSNLGYDHHTVYFNSMFAHPTPQSRDRMYIIFWKKGNKPPDLEFRPKAYCHRCETVVEAVQTWKNTKMVRDRGGRWGRYGVQYVYCCSDCLWKAAKKHGRKLSDKHLHLAEVVPFYYAAFNCIDWSIAAPRIGDRPKPLAPKTMARIRYGLERYGREPLIITGRYTSGIDSRIRQVGSGVLPTQPGDSSHALLTPFVIQTTRVGSPASITEGLPTQTTCQGIALVRPPFMVETKYSHSGDNRVGGVDDPAATQTGQQSMGLVAPPMLVSTNYFDDRAIPAHSKPTGAQTTQTKWALVGPPAFLSRQYGGLPAPISMDEAAGTITTQDHHALIGMPPFIAELRGTGSASGIDEALATVTAGGNNHALIATEQVNAFLSYYYGNMQASGVDDPVCTVTSRDHAGLVQMGEEVSVEDCTFRMMAPHEIKAAMAFPSDYIVLGTNRDQVKQCGNAVTPPVMEMLIREAVRSLL